jgi:hypothetical protein
MLIGVRPLLGTRPAALQIGDSVVRGLRPVRGGKATSKAGRVVLTGRVDGRRVKVYEAANREHAEFILRTTKQRPGGLSFPPIAGLAGRFVLCDWVEGKPLSACRQDSGFTAALARLQASIHSVSLDPNKGAGFDYWADLVAPRFRRAAELAGKDRIADDKIRLLETWRSDARKTLAHPDLSPANVVLTGALDLIPVDNELLYHGAGAFMDILNTMNSLPAAERPGYLQAYRAASSLSPFPSLEIMAAFWLARRSGSVLASGHLEKLPALFEADRAGETDELLASFG